MKPNHLCRHFRVGVFALVLGGSVSSLYAQDELEQLLFGGSASSHAIEPAIVPTSDALDVLLVDGIVEEIANDETIVTLPRLPRVPAVKKRPSVAAVDASLPADQAKPSTVPHVDLVPEPSALAMGAVALLFFLLLGRRRRVG